ncbi:MAG: hypothetical protein ACR2RE_15895 [Geminicoccaceae bacterium]
MAVLFVGFLTWLGIASSPVEAACDAKLERVETASWSRSGGYDAFDPTGYADQFAFEILHLDKDGVPCEVIATLEAAGGARLDGPGQDQLAFDLRTDANLPNGSGRLTFRLGLEPGERTRVAYFVFLPPGQFVGSGSHEGRLTIDLVEDLDGSVEVEDRRDVAVRASVGSGARISFVGAVGRRQTVDFGELTDGKTSPPVFLDVRSTADFEIRLTSEERGDLVQRADGKVWRVPYITRIDGDRVDLDRVNSSGRNFSGPTDPAGQRLPITFQLGTIGDQRAGSYRDRITIEVFPASR